jgi:hypothetical protein
MMILVSRTLKPSRAVKLGLAVPWFFLAAACTPPADTVAAADSASTVVAPSPERSNAPSTVLAAQPAFSWQAVAPSAILSTTPPAKLSLGEGYVSLLYPSTSVSVGDTFDFTFTASGAPGGLRVVMVRHCGQGSDKDSVSQDFSVGDKPAEFTLSHTFAEAHPCLRVSFLARDKVANTVEIWNWKLTPPTPKAPAAPAPTPVAPPPQQ